MTPPNICLVYVAILLTNGWAPHAFAAVVPDPSDCFFYPVETSQEKGGPSVYPTPIAALSGNGRVAIQHIENTIDFHSTVYLLVDEYLVRDGSRSLFHNHQASGQNGNYSEDGPRWSTAGLSYDGSVALINVSSPARSFPPRATLWNVVEKSETQLPLQNGLMLSADGNWVLGGNSETTLWRVRTSDQRVFPALTTNDIVAARVYGISGDGQRFFGNGIPRNGTEYQDFLWTAEDGLRWQPFPEGFHPRSMDSSGQLFAGYLYFPDRPEEPEAAALWSAGEGLRKLPISSPIFPGTSATGFLVSGNGELVFGAVRNNGEVTPAVWTRTGTLYRFNELLRGVDLKGAVLSVPDRVSHDGRTVAGKAFTTNYVNINYVAGLALPGEGPKLSLQPTPGGAGSLGFRTKIGYRYQPQQWLSPGTWAGVSESIPGTDLTVSIPVPTNAADGGLFRVVVTPQ